MGASASKTSCDATCSPNIPRHEYKLFKDVRVEFEFKKGDMLEVHRGLTCHWMLYIGEYMVVHISVDPTTLICCCAGHVITDDLVEDIKDKAMFENIYKGVVKVSKIDDALKDAEEVRVNNKEDLAKKANMKPFSVKETVKRAINMRGKEVDYQFQKKNCEYYVTSWKYENAKKLLEADCEDSIGKSLGSFLYSALVELGRLLTPKK